MFRTVDLPAGIPGKLLLHSMPGRFEKLEQVWWQVKTEAIALIVCLAEEYEVRAKSTAYADALALGVVPCSVLPCEIREGGAPADRDRFWALAGEIARRLRHGEAVLVHCAGGVGRTAMLAITVLLALGESMNSAERTVSRAGSIVETIAQMELLSWCAAAAAARQHEPG
jgi:protein-tyrosine phosphatase